ncbi:MAG: hypothetical protein JNK82_01165 [Myxococcaceae bacterium]|nr:hypothetical protein [Myxococcaceae bacterium]
MRSQRDHLEQLQAELKSLQAEREVVRARLIEARSRAEAAAAREREAAQQYASSAFVFTNGLDTARRGAVGALRFTLVAALVLGVFGAVLGSVTFAVKAYRDKITQLAERE